MEFGSCGAANRRGARSAATRWTCWASRMRRVGAAGV